jgi:hypothetical protein
MSLYRDGEAFARRNQAILAKRTGWPAGALEACSDLEDRFPGWHVSWLAENRIAGFERPAGYWAVNVVDPFHHAEAFREDLGELTELLVEGVPKHAWGLDECWWCMRHSDARRVKL